MDIVEQILTKPEEFRNPARKDGCSIKVTIPVEIVRRYKIVPGYSLRLSLLSVTKK